MHSNNSYFPSKKSLFFSEVVGWWLIVFYWIGVVFYDFIDANLGASWTDELLVALLFLTFIVSSLHCRYDYSLALWSTLIFSVYFIYALLFGANAHEAIVSDFVVVSKSFIAFTILFTMRPLFSTRLLSYLKYSAVTGGFFVLLVAIGGEEWVRTVFTHPSRLATTAIISGLLYMVAAVSIRPEIIKLNNLLVFFAVIVVSLFSARAKAYGFVTAALAISLYFYFYRFRARPLSFGKAGFMTWVVLTLVFYSVLDKLVFYFIEGVEGVEMFARPALYSASLDIALDYFPFGAGFGSFGSHYSGVYYSPLYYDYGLSDLWGLTPEAPWFISDTFFPMVIAQFGFFGVLLLFYILVGFFYRVNAASGRHFRLNGYLMCFVLIFVFCCIESFADSTVVQNRGVFILSLMGGISGLIISRRFH